MLDSKPSIIVIENKDRLTRFGFNYLQKLLKNQGTEIIVINKDNEDQTDLIKDMCSVIYSFCAKLYGMRRAANKTNAIKQQLEIN
jgi:predicted site-specific integrase-resolvase